MNYYEIKRDNKWIELKFEYYLKLINRYSKLKIHNYLIDLDNKPFRDLVIRLGNKI